METMAHISAFLVNDDKIDLTSFTSQLKDLTTGFKNKKNITRETEIFLVDDDQLYLTAMEHFLLSELSSIKIMKFKTGEASLQHIYLQPDIVILDYRLNDDKPSAKNGIEILKKIKEQSPDTKVIMLSSQDSLNVAMNCLDEGAFDYISKSESAFVKIQNTIVNIIENLETIEKVNKHFNLYHITSIIIIIILILSLLLG